MVNQVFVEGEVSESTARLVTSEFDDQYDIWDPKQDPPTLVPDLVTRAQWGAVPPRYREPLCTPVTSVLVCDTRSEFCMCQETCGIVLRKLQAKYMDEKGMPDIPWNFMIGDDGRVYEGRGWVTNPDKTNDDTQKHHGATLDIAYIGNYQAKFPTPKMTKVMNALFDIGCDKTVIDSSFEIKSDLMNEFKEENIPKERFHEK